ncbi:MAG: hypothetical protein VW258_04050, partial [Thalassolituus sp.]
MKSLCKTLIPALALVSAQAMAHDFANEAHPTKPKFEFGVGIFGGGEELASMEYADGSDQTVKAGAGLNLYVGAVVPVASQFSAQVRLGWLSDSATGQTTWGGYTVEYYFQRYPLDVMARFDQGKHGFALGVTKHLSTTFGIEIDDESSDVDIDSNLGMVAEYQYQFGPRAY